MKRYILYILLFCVQMLAAQEQQTVTTTQSGELNAKVSNPGGVKKLQVSGFMDARDFFFLRENCPNLTDLNIKNVKITAYESYREDEIPKFALSRKLNAETWLDLRLNSDKQTLLAPADTLSSGKRVFFADKTTTWSSIGLQADLPLGASISPNPAAVTIADGTTISFTVTSESGHKATYQYVVTLDNWFTAIICADSEIDMRSNNTQTTKQYVNKAINIHNYAYSYSTYDFITPKTELMIMAGDMDKDRGGQLSDFDNVFKQVTDAGIPMITISGNHDWEPDYFDDGSAGYLSLTGLPSNKRTLNVVSTYLNRSKNLGVSNAHVFTSQYEQVNPFTFKFRNVRFYMGQNYWFQPPYKSSFYGTSTFYAPDTEIINPLTDSISSRWGNDAAVWIQHYPFNCADKWWLHQNGNGQSQNSNLGTWTTAAAKRDKLKDMMSKTKNPIFFAGHNHTEATHTHTYNSVTFREHIAGYFPDGKVFMVLMREGIGVVEVKSIQL